MPDVMGSKRKFFEEADGGREQICAQCLPLLWKRTDCIKIPDGAHVLLLGSNSLSHRCLMWVCVCRGKALPHSLTLSPVSMDNSDDHVDPGLLTADDQEDDSHQILGHFDADEIADDDQNVSSQPPQSPIADENEPDQPDAVHDDDEPDEEQPEERTAPQADDDLDSDDEEIRKLEAEANAPDLTEASYEGEEESDAPPQKVPTADGQLIADIFGDSDSEDEGFEVMWLFITVFLASDPFSFTGFQSGGRC
jgi:hypothetical protein